MTGPEQAAAAGQVAAVRSQEAPRDVKTTGVPSGTAPVTPTTLEMERARLAAVVASQRDAIVVVDANGQPILQNDAYRRLVEEGDPMPKGEQGRPLLPDERLRQRAAGGERFIAQFRGADDAGSRLWYEVYGQPVSVGDATHGGVLIIRDITERSLRQLQNEFVAMVAHELRTPLTALRGYLQLLGRRIEGDADADPTQVRYAALATEQARRLQDLIGDLFDTARVEAGAFHFAYAQVDFGAVVREALEVARTLSDRHRIEAGALDEGLLISADAGRLQQVILNVIANAVTHAPRAERIDVTLRRGGGYAALEIADHGPGIAPGDLPTVFTRYRQGAAGLGGLGLGLFISREIVTAHGGTIEASVTPSGGTTIIVRLPLIGTAGSPPQESDPA